MIVPFRMPESRDLRVPNPHRTLVDMGRKRSFVYDASGFINGHQALHNMIMSVNRVVTRNLALPLRVQESIYSEEEKGGVLAKLQEQSMLHSLVKLISKKKLKLPKGNLMKTSL